MRLQRLVPEDLVGVQERYFSTTAWVVGISGQPNIVRSAIEGVVDIIDEWTAEGYE